MKRALAFLLVFASAATAHAQANEARRRFELGLELYDRGDDEAALGEFRASHRMREVPSVLLNIAVVLRRLGRDAEAADTLRRYLLEERRVDAARRREIEQEIATIERMLGTIALEVTPSDAAVLIDGRLVEESGPLRARAGEHEIVARRDGYSEARRTITVRAGETSAFAMTLERATSGATLIVTSEPSGARAMIDGEEAGTTPLERRLTSGGHRLRLELDGYPVVEREIMLSAQRQEEHVDLAGEPIWQAWWLWTIVAVGVAGGIALGVGLGVGVGGQSGPVAPAGTLFTYP